MKLSLFLSSALFASFTQGSTGQCIDDPNTIFTVLAFPSGTKEVGCEYMSEPGISIQQKKNRYSNWCTGANDKSDSCPVSCEAAYTFGAYPNGVLEDVTCSYINEDGISATQLSNRFNNFCVTGPVAANCPCTCTAAKNRLDHKGSKSPSTTKKPKKTKKTKAPTAACQTQPDGTVGYDMTFATIFPAPVFTESDLDEALCSEVSSNVFDITGVATDVVVVFKDSESACDELNCAYTIEVTAYFTPAQVVIAGGIMEVQKHIRDQLIAASGWQWVLLPAGSKKSKGTKSPSSKGTKSPSSKGTKSPSSKGTKAPSRRF